MEPFYPLHVRVCTRCWLAQLPAFVAAGRRSSSEYAYFSAYSDSWVEHARALRRDDHASGSGSTSESLVVELASNDGYLLQHFLPKGIPVLGIDPAANVARAAEERGVPTLVEFFGVELAERLVARGQAGRPRAREQRARAGARPERLRRRRRDPARARAAPRPSSSRISPGCSTASSTTRSTTSTSRTSRSSTIREVFAAHGLDGRRRRGAAEPRRLAPRLRAPTRPTAREPIAAVAELARPRGGGGASRPGALPALRGRRQGVEAGAARAPDRAARATGKQVVGYGAPGKGNTLLNYCGIRTDFLDYTVDRNPYKHGRFTPGTHIPIHPPERIAETRPDAIVILPWNLAREIAAQLAYTDGVGGEADRAGSDRDGARARPDRRLTPVRV